MTTAYAAQPIPTTDLANPAQFEQFVSSHAATVFSVCQRLLKDRYAAEDACQETFAAAWRHRRELQPNRAWLLKVATNKCLDELRSRSRRRAHLLDGSATAQATLVISPAPSPEMVALSAHAESALLLALGRLPAPQRTAVVLSDVEGWSYREIAQACGISMGTVKSRIFRARKTLRLLLDEAAFFD